MQQRVLIINCSDRGNWISPFVSALDQGVKRFVELSSPIIEYLIQKAPDFTLPIPLTTIILGTVLESNSISYDVVAGINIEKLEARLLLLDDNYTTILISTTFIYSNTALNSVAQLIRDKFPRSIIIAGGPLLSRNDKIFETKNIDRFYFGAGENNLVDLIINGPCSVPGVAYSRGNQFIYDGKINHVDLDNQLYPNWDVLKKCLSGDALVKYTLFEEFLVESIRGCLHRCAFCNAGSYYKKTTIKSPQRIIEEMFRIKEFGGKRLSFWDSNLTNPLDRFKELCKLIQSNGLTDLNISSYGRISDLSPEILELLNTSGWRHLFVGLETANESILKSMRKRITLQEIKRFYTSLNSKEWNFDVQSGILVGFPGETPSTLNETYTFIEEYAPKMIVISPLAIAPGSDLQLNPQRYSLKYENAKPFEWQHSTMSSQEANELSIDLFLKTVKLEKTLVNNIFTLSMILPYKLTFEKQQYNKLLLLFQKGIGIGVENYLKIRSNQDARNKVQEINQRMEELITNSG